MNKPTRILIVDDHQIFRQGLRALLNGLSGMEVVGEAQDGRAAVRLAAELLPDVVIMDINMPELNGIEATRQVNEAGRGTRIIALSAYSDGKFSSEMLKAGARGYIRKDSTFDELALAIKTVMGNEIYLSPGMTGEIVKKFMDGGNGHGATVFSTLSPREREVLQLIAEGKATKQVAMHLHVSVKTIETHRRNIMEKLNLDSVAGLTKYAIREGVTSAET